MRAFFLSFILCCAAAWGVSPDALKLDSPVVDQAGVIDAAQEAELTRLLRDWQAQGLMQGAVVLVDSTDGMDDFDYAMRVAERWGLGSRERDHGLLLFLAVKERKVRMLTGTGLEGALPDISAAKIIRDQVVPNLRAGDFAGAMRQGLQAAALRLQADPAAQAEMVAQDRGGTPSFRAPSHEPEEFTRLLTWLFFGAIITQVVSMIARKSTWARVLHGTLFGSVFGGVFGAGFSQAANIAWLMPLFLVGGAVLFGVMAYLRPKPKRVRRRDDDDDDNSGFWGGFGGGFGSSSGGFGGGSSSSGGYSGGGGSFSGGGAGSSW